MNSMNLMSSLRPLKLLSLFALVLTLGLSFGMSDAEAAKRLGGGKSFGMQRQMAVPNKPAPTAAPNPSQASAAAPGAAGATAAAAPKRSWAGPLAGLAAGLGIAALASYLGFGSELASMLMLGLLVMAAIAVIGFFMRKRAPQRGSPALAGAGGAQYRQMDEAPSALAREGMTAAGSGSVGAVAALPADFDAAGFVRNAKVHFIRLQAANDKGDLDDIREFTTPEMFAEVKMAIAERGDAVQETDVVSVDAEVIDVVEEANRYIVGVRFTGLIREEKNAPAEPIDEIWHLTKPRSGQGGWLLAGIQQTL